nr:Na/Pi cotransporter [Bacillaceae bacterium]
MKVLPFPCKNIPQNCAFFHFLFISAPLSPGRIFPETVSGGPAGKKKQQNSFPKSFLSLPHRPPPAPAPVSREILLFQGNFYTSFLAEFIHWNRGEDMLPFLFGLLVLLFICGMMLIRYGMMHIAGQKMKKWLLRFAGTPLKGFFSGILITAILQSSSAVMIITVGFISAKLLSFRRSLGIILGANIGTTITVEFLAFSTDQMVFPLMLLGTVFFLIPREAVRNAGFFLFGLGAVFFSLFGFERFAGPLSAMKWTAPLFSAVNEHESLAVLAGCLLTAVIQSSTAMTGILMGFMEAKVLSVSAAIAALLGANIGTCADAYLASIGGGKEAKLAAFAHIWLNILGAALFFPFLAPFSHLVEKLAADPEQQLAHAAVLFNAAVSLLFLPFTGSFAGLIEKIHGK